MSLFGRHVRFIFHYTISSVTSRSFFTFWPIASTNPHLESTSASSRLATRNPRGDRSCSKVARRLQHQTKSDSQHPFQIAVQKPFQRATHATHIASYLGPLDRPHHALRLRLWEARPPQGHILPDSACRYWTMQRLSLHVLQTPQWEIQEGEEGGGDGKRKESKEGGEDSQSQREGSETRRSSCSLASDGPHSPCPSPSPSLDRETPRYAPPSRSLVPRGRLGRLGGLEGDAVTPASVEDSAFKRPVLGPRALGAPSWKSTAETVPSQLLGRRPEGNADVLEPNSVNFATPLPDRKTNDQQPDEVEHPHSYLSPSWILRQDTDPVLPRSDGKEYSPPELPSPNQSGSSFTSGSKSSQHSYASSFAYLLRNTRNDMRLFKKRSRPSQHFRKAPTLEKRPSLPRRLSSYYKPRVIEDSAVLSAPTPAKLSPDPSPSLTLKPPIPTLSTPRTAIRKARSSPSQSTTESASVPASQSPSPSKRTIVPIFSRDHDFSQVSFQSRRIRMESSSDSGSPRGNITLSHVVSDLDRDSGLPSLSSELVKERRHRRITPPEGEPQTPLESADSHGEHYFRIFGAETIYQKQYSPITSPIASEQPRSMEPPAASSTRSVSPSPSTRQSSDRSKAHRKSRRGSSFLGKLWRAEVSHYVFHGHSGQTSIPSSPTPDITVSSPVLAKSRRRSSISSYFSGRVKSPPETTPSPANSGLSTNWEDVVAESQPAGHAKEISEPMSPLSVSPTLKRPQPTPVQDRSAEPTGQRPVDSEGAAIPFEVEAGKAGKYKSASGEEFYKVHLTGPKAVNFLPSEMKRVNTPPEVEKPKGFKGFFFDMRSIPAEPSDADSESPEARAMKRRSPIFQRRSLQSMVSKFSLPKLRQKSDQAAEEPKEPDDPLAVTGFQQTPFSQRYGDARRAKMSQIRSYIAETLREDDDDETAFPFALNVPDHLPNSPLCPLSPKHKSGGKAICPIHGRKKTTIGPTQAKAVRVGTAKATRQEPRIVFESGQQGDGPSSPSADYLRWVMEREG